MPELHGTLLQQVPELLQIWPYDAQVGPVPAEPPVLVLPAFEDVPPAVVPPVAVDPPRLPVPPAPPELAPPVPLLGGVLQTPEIEPGARRQLLPGQQSPSIVQLLPEGTQFGPLPTFEQINLPDASGVQGTSSQQSAADAQLWPAVRQALIP
ncbi:MAG TPA: hypothetical protein VER11_18135 [Polyangiaceae bacterium]|nr:hypothetical protein [Polyangiaceae bacterium]